MPSGLHRLRLGAASGAGLKGFEAAGGVPTVLGGEAEEVGFLCYEAEVVLHAVGCISHAIA